MSYAAFKLMHCPTGIENCASGYITHSAADFPTQMPPIHSDDLDPEWPAAKRGIGPIPNLIVTAANVLEVYIVRAQDEDGRTARPQGDAPRSRVLAGVAGASLELACHYRLHGNVETMAVLSVGGDDSCRRRDSIVLAFQDAKIVVLEYDDSLHGLRTSSMHCFEGPEWHYLKRGRESFSQGPLIKVDPQGRCGGVLVYGLQMIILKASQEWLPTFDCNWMSVQYVTYSGKGPNMITEPCIILNATWCHCSSSVIAGTSYHDLRMVSKNSWFRYDKFLL